jgi:MoaA/NifB/PqqE/SkfB family radical SAM enzyme
LKCPECAIGNKLITKKKGFMRFEQFKIIANKIRPLCQYLYLHHNGEPLLNPDIFQMIEYASKFAGVNISTNGQSLNKNKAEKLILSGVTEIIVSIDGFSQKVYQQYRVGGSAGKALWSLNMLQEFNRLHGERVKIMPQFIVFKHNQHEMDLFAEFCQFLGLNPFFKAPFIREGSQFTHAENPEYRRSSFPDLASLRQQMKSCPDPREVFTILLDGTCVMCCNDNNGITAYGNIFDQEVLDIWNSPCYKKDRWDIVSGKAPNYCIENCLVWSLRPNEYSNSIGY